MNTLSRQIQFSPSALLVLKLFAFGAMVFDHADMFLGDGQGAHATIGRMVFPIFGVVLAFNLARVDPSRIVRELVPRALAVGAIAQLAYIVLQGGAFPLNIMFTLAAGMLVYAAIEFGELAAALALFLIAGIFVDYSWQGVVGVAIVAAAFRDGRPQVLWLSIVTFCLLLAQFSANAWAFAAIPALWFAARYLQGNAPRLKWLFWVGYPAHLGLLAAVMLL